MSAGSATPATRLVDWGREYVSNTLLASLLVGGWLPAVLVGFALALGDPSGTFVFGTVLAAVFVVFGPYDVWLYERRIFPDFFSEVDQLVPDDQQSEIAALEARFTRIFRDRAWQVVLPWTALVVAVFFSSQSFFAGQGIDTASPVAYYAFLLFFVYWGLFTGMGIHGGIVTVFAIRSMSETVSLNIEPLHPDNLGGLSTIGNFAIRTTVILSTGSLAFPLSFQIAGNSGYEEFVYAGVVVFTVTVALVFVYPTWKIHQRAQAIREDILEDYRQEIRELERQVSVDSESASPEDLNRNLALQLEIQRVRREFREFREVNLYPMSIDILVRLVSSIILPLLFLFFELYVKRFIWGA